MGDLLFTLEVAVALAVALLLTYLLTIATRRRAIARGGLLTAAVLSVPSHSAGRWRTGFVRFGDGHLEWFTLGGVTLRPRASWPRRLLELGSPVPSDGTEGLRVEEPVLVVPCRVGAEEFRLGLGQAAYTALRSWVEAAPPESVSAVN
ncbi:MAG TPA: DUF2550 family protein [Dermatophilaceae bacterium]|nr:DUF2550 family protein [Dermatophilaceae bacterium]